MTILSDACARCHTSLWVGSETCDEFRELFVDILQSMYVARFLHPRVPPPLDAPRGEPTPTPMLEQLANHQFLIDQLVLNVSGNPSSQPSIFLYVYEKLLHLEAAIQLLGLAFAYADSTLMDRMEKWSLFTRLREQLQCEIGPDAYHVAWENGAALELETTLLELMEYLGDEQPCQTGPANEMLLEPLTNRELEVLALLADGLSNREIAEELTVVVGTVKTHVYNICQKVRAKNRTQAVAKARTLKLL